MKFLARTVHPTILSLALCFATAASGQQPGRLGVLVEESPAGAAIREVLPGSAAAKAGLVPGDVVVAIDSTAISSAVPLTTVVQHMAAGQKVQVKIRRGSETKTFTVALDGAVAAAPVTPRPPEAIRRMQEEMRGSAFGLSQFARPMLGVALQPVDPAMRERLKLGAQEGMCINSVRPGSAAADAGLQVDDVLLSINGKAISSAEVASQIVGSAKPEAPLTLKVWRNGTAIEKKATVRPPAAGTAMQSTIDFPPRLFSTETPGADRIQQLEAINRTLEARVRSLEVRLQLIEQQLHTARASGPSSPAVNPVPPTKK